MSSSPTDVRAASSTDVLMPRMGTSVAEGTVVAWHVAVGDAVERDQVLCEVSTDKVDVECPAPAGGVLAEILVPAGETVDVGVVLARLRPAGDGGLAGFVGSPGASGGGTVPAPPPTDPREARRDVLRRSSPVAARLAADHGIDVRALTGSGRNGRVTKRDVLAAAGGGPTTSDAPTAPDGAGGPIAGGPVADGPVATTPAAATGAPAPAADQAPMHTESPYRHDPSIPVAGAPGTTAPGSPTAPAPGDAAAAPATPAPDAPGSGAAGSRAAERRGIAVPADLGGIAVPATRMRRAIGGAVRRSIDTAAHCTTVVECDMGAVERERRELGLTALPLVAHAVVRTLHRFPALNATFDGETVTRYGDRVHLGIAVSLGDDGLIAPVIHDAQDLSVAGLARRIKDLATRARAGRLEPDEVRGGTFTLTNPGAAGALLATPVISLPQVAILDLEAIVRRPVVVTAPDGTESIGIRPMVHLCMGWDHRALDGLYAAQFLTALRGRLEG